MFQQWILQIKIVHIYWNPKVSITEFVCDFGRLGHDSNAIPSILTYLTIKHLFLNTKVKKQNWCVGWWSKTMGVGELSDILKTSLGLRAKDDGSGNTQKLFYSLHSLFTPRNLNQLSLIPLDKELKKHLSKCKTNSSVAELACCWYLVTVPFKPQAFKNIIPTAGTSSVGPRLALSFCWRNVSFLHTFCYISPVSLAF